MREDTKDIYSQVTDRIVRHLEEGVRPWQQPWTGGDPGIPARHNGNAYRGVNILLLWLEALSRGYTSPTWLTYKQALIEGGKVRPGERGSMVVFAKPVTVTASNGKDEKDEKTEKRVRLLRYYTVFNVEQIDGLPDSFNVKLPEPLPVEKRVASAEDFVKATAAVVRHGGVQAFYSPSEDFIQMPPFERFKDAESYYATLLHELTHWTRHKSRLNRDFGQKQQGDPTYAFEELVAEIGAAFLCTHIRITPVIRDDHASYIDFWLKALKDDNRAIIRAASLAQEAVDYLQQVQPSHANPTSETDPLPGSGPAIADHPSRAATDGAQRPPKTRQRKAKRIGKPAPEPA
ncbi:MAG: zincin-like metallopeptidase domain-containing protein [Chthoniobacter sp.]|nr:zincin-like metallopeptidase domain-containing protein [Chthoniobacter sp.]